MLSTSAAPRMPMPDISRFFGIILVYYGHIIERFMYLNAPSAASQYKFIYSFHMVFFFLLSGYVFRQEKLHVPVRRFLARQAASRIVPYLAFSALLTVLSLFLPGHFVLVKPGVHGYLSAWWMTLLGMPVFNIPLWFLAALFSVELLHHVLGRYLTGTATMLGAAACLYLVGYYLTLDYMFLPGPSYWFVLEAPVMYAFYLVGVCLRQSGILERCASRGGLVALAALTALGVWFTYDLNQGPFKVFQAVVIVLSGHGNVFWFPVTALCGSLLLFFLASLPGENRILQYLGKNTIIIFCLNGVFYHFCNGPFAEWATSGVARTPLSVTLVCLGFTVFSLLVCIPCVVVLTRLVPQLVGRPYATGPLLPALVRR